MSDSHLKTRGRLTTTIDNEILAGLKKLTAETQVPITRLLDEAILDLLVKYDRWNGPVPGRKRLMGVVSAYSGGDTGDDTRRAAAKGGQSPLEKR
ncbi:MAG: ribbon-helix-helix domain-containing protein [Clostridiales bacterium]|nr:ribbon-helix-helix domain-containing protein [Clostridiales bacterium]